MINIYLLLLDIYFGINRLPDDLISSNRNKLILPKKGDNLMIIELLNGKKYVITIEELK